MPQFPAFLEYWCLQPVGMREGRVGGVEVPDPTPQNPGFPVPALILNENILSYSHTFYYKFILYPIEKQV